MPLKDYGLNVGLEDYEYWNGDDYRRLHRRRA
jgi:hypothetical protein